MRPMPLCGFAARCNADSAGVDDPLAVRALVIESDDQRVGILSYDLLALGAAIHDRIVRALRDRLSAPSKRDCWLLCATHTHGAPAAIELLGCGDIQPDYLDQLTVASVDCARKAIQDLRPARFRYAEQTLAGRNRNRRTILKDGRVTMSDVADDRVVERGPVWDRMLFVRFEDFAGRGIVTLFTWPCHPDTVCGFNVTADFPGELCRRLSLQQGAPHLYLQGACGNLNPHFKDMTREEMLQNADAIMKMLVQFDWQDYTADAPPRACLRQTISIKYQPLPNRERLEFTLLSMREIAETGHGPDGMIRILADILNVEPGQEPDAGMIKYIAAIIARWCQTTLERMDADTILSCDLQTAVLRLGDVFFCFAGAEPFVETAIRLRRRFPEKHVALVGYAGPLIGYLPTDVALKQGGYESEYAYRFYNHPAPFAAGAEDRLLDAFSALIETITGGRHVGK